MFIIAKYLAKNHYRSFLMILLPLLGLFTIFSLIENIESMNSSIISIFYFQFLSMPGRIYDLIPISTLIGTALSINLLSKNNEWIIFNISGISNIRLVSILCLINIPIVIFSMFLSEYLVPISEIKNLNNKIIKESHNNKFDSGYWINDIKNTGKIINISNIMQNGAIEKITLYEFTENKKLYKIYFAEYGEFAKKSIILNNVTIKTINNSIFENKSFAIKENYIETSFLKNLCFETNINKKFLLINKLTTNRMPIFELYKYKASNLISSLQEIELYNKISYLLLLFLMMIIAANSIKINQNRNKNRLAGTLIIGVIVFVIIKLLSIIGSIYSYKAILTTLIPNISILILSICNIIKRENL